jgi:hypothetical protein
LPCGLNAFHKHHIPSYAFLKTIEFAQQNNLPVPQNSFVDSTILKVGSENVVVCFLVKDIREIMLLVIFLRKNTFGGCLIKELNASKGYLGDANINAWSNTVEKSGLRCDRLLFLVTENMATANCLIIPLIYLKNNFRNYIKQKSTNKIGAFLL